MIYKLRIVNIYFNGISKPLSYFCSSKQQEPVSKTNNEQPTDKLYFWKINKLYNSKRCYRLFKQNFGQVQSATHLCKLKNKPFFIMKFNKIMQNEQFRKQHAKQQSIKSKNCVAQLQLQYKIKDKHYKNLSELQEEQQIIIKQPNPQDLQRVKSIRIQDIVSPLHRLSKQQQMAYKTSQIKQVINKYMKTYNQNKQAIEQKKRITNLQLKQFYECPKQFRYTRSKCEFTIGKGANGEPTVGFTKGSFSDNTVMVQSAQNTQIITKQMKHIAQCIEQFIITNLRQYQNFVPYDKMTHNGFWRYVVVRQSQRTAQIMIIIVCKTEGYDNQQVQIIKKRLKQKLIRLTSNIKSILFQQYDGKGDFVPTGPYEELLGSSYYQQIILNRRFKISAGAFIQTHIPMVQLLYRQVISKANNYDLVLDVGCGVGIIGTLIMKQCKQTKVIGIDINEQSIQDAKENNNQYDARLGKAEDLIKQICQQNKGKNLLAILDPPRSGFGKSVMKALRRCQGLNNIIYIACNPAAIQDNLLYLTLPIHNRRICPSFQISEIKGFDMFPLTKHFQMIYLLNRPVWTQEKII